MPEAPATPPSSNKLPPPSFSLPGGDFCLPGDRGVWSVPNPIDGKTEVRLDLAKHAIDMLAIVEQKTKAIAPSMKRRCSKACCTSFG